MGPLNRYGWWKRQDRRQIRQQVIEHLMRQIMHYDAEFRREDAAVLASHAALAEGLPDIGPPKFA